MLYLAHVSMALVSLHGQHTRWGGGGELNSSTKHDGCDLRTKGGKGGS